MKTLVLTACVLSGGAGGAWAETTAKTEDHASGISIELSAAEDVGATCKLSFVVTNGHDGDIDQAVYETVLFDAAGQGSRLTLLDFQGLPARRLRVRQFQFPQACSDISRVLINGAETCGAPGLDDGACSQGLTLISRTGMELLG
ncbi:hypothetical protein [Pseudophaeobacter leonis]|uniref:hypothetical protein n=1 Tax=Pseudophaeobacter leonis TaxID=1144477 RepID=UPI0009F32D39|nr:hypothetical protein [Pseudophaeobacter leonis]